MVWSSPGQELSEAEGEAEDERLCETEELCEVVDNVVLSKLTRLDELDSDCELEVVEGWTLLLVATELVLLCELDKLPGVEELDKLETLVVVDELDRPLLLGVTDAVVVKELARPEEVEADCELEEVAVGTVLDVAELEMLSESEAVDWVRLLLVVTELDSDEEDVGRLLKLVEVTGAFVEDASVEVGGPPVVELNEEELVGRLLKVDEVAGALVEDARDDADDREVVV